MKSVHHPHCALYRIGGGPCNCGVDTTAGKRDPMTDHDKPSEPEVITVPSDLRLFSFSGPYVTYVAARTGVDAFAFWCEETGTDPMEPVEWEELTMDALIQVEEDCEAVMTARQAIEDHVNEGGGFPAIIAQEAP